MSRYIDIDRLGIGKCNPDIFNNKEYAKGWNAAIDIIEKTPTAKVQPVRHGKWIACFEDWRNQFEGDECSICGFKHYGSRYNYCPNCGAYMKGKDNE